jgi:hypothetical protein
MNVAVTERKNIWYCIPPPPVPYSVPGCTAADSVYLFGNPIPAAGGGTRLNPRVLIPEQSTICPARTVPPALTAVRGAGGHGNCPLKNNKKHGFCQKSVFLGDLKPTFGWQITNRVIEQVQ